MSTDKKEPVDSEKILITLDQIGQTIEIMTSVVGRLRGYINENNDHPITANNEDFDISNPYQEQSQTIH